MVLTTMCMTTRIQAVTASQQQFHHRRLPYSTKRLSFGSNQPTLFVKKKARDRRQSRLQATSSEPEPDSSSTPESSSKSSAASLLSSRIQQLTSPLGALALLTFVILFHESGHYLSGKALGLQVQEFSVGFGPQLWHWTLWGDDFSLRALPVGGYVNFNQSELRALPVLQQLVILSAGVVFNWLLAIVLFFIPIRFGKGLVKPRLETGIVVTGLDGKQAAANGILKPGDVILGINGQRIALSSSPSEPAAQRALTQLIRTVQGTPLGESIELLIQRPSNQASPTTVSIQPKRITPEGPATVGAFLSPNLVGFDRFQSEDLLEAAALASTYAFLFTRETANGLWLWLTDVVTGQADSSEYRVTGPVGVVQRATAVVTTQETNTIVQYMAMLSINLSLLNLVPIPPTDGFQILVTLVSAASSSLQT